MRVITGLVLALVLPGVAGGGDETSLESQAQSGLKRACEFYRTQVADHGGYLWRYSADLARREGEGRVETGTVWVQPPGTPTVGQAYLAAFLATGDHLYLDAAREVALALVAGQLQSGGWDYRIVFDPQDRRRYAYRVEGDTAAGRNTSTLDDNTTQAALSFLIDVDQATGGKDAAVRGAVDYALKSLLAVQYPAGAWPQRFAAATDPKKFPVLRASYPQEWSRTHPKKDYRGFYTLNDNVLADMVDVLLLAARAYDRSDCREAALRSGDFLILAQMPEPQPAWAQQYNAQMEPAWARKFEPPAVTGGESQGALRTLLAIYAETGEEKYLEPVDRAIAYLRRSALPDGQLARFYELKTNRPLYFTLEYELTYSDADMPTHYGFKTGSGLDAIEARMKKLVAGQAKSTSGGSAAVVTDAMRAEAQSVLDALDEAGRWVEQGRLKYHGSDDPTRQIIDSRSFARNVAVLCNFLTAGKQGSN